MSIAVEDWDDLSAARRRRDERTAAEEPATTAGQDAPAASVRALIATAAAREDESLDDERENLRPLLSVAGANIVVWVLAHVTGIVELLGVSFFASIGLLLAAYILREWHRDRGALVCLIGALPLPLTIFGLLT
jgi:hypothetical protein